MASSNRKSKQNNEALCCSFCGKAQEDVFKLIAGPAVFVCNECIELCVNIVIEEEDDKNVKKFIKNLNIDVATITSKDGFSSIIGKAKGSGLQITNLKFVDLTLQLYAKTFLRCSLSR